MSLSQRWAYVGYIKLSFVLNDNFISQLTKYQTEGMDVTFFLFCFFFKTKSFTFVQKLKVPSDLCLMLYILSLIMWILNRRVSLKFDSLSYPELYYNAYRSHILQTCQYKSD